MNFLELSQWLRIADLSQLTMASRISYDALKSKMNESRQNCTSGHRSMITCVAISPDGKLAASGDDDGVIVLWRTSDGLCLATLYKHFRSINILAFSKNGRILASGAQGEYIVLWDVVHKRKKHVLSFIFQKPVNEENKSLFFFCPNDSFFYYGNKNPNYLGACDLDSHIEEKKDKIFADDAIYLANISGYFFTSITECLPLVGDVNQLSGRYALSHFVYLLKERISTQAPYLKAEYGRTSDIEPKIVVRDLFHSDQVVYSKNVKVGDMFAISPNGRYLAYSNDESFIVMVDLVNKSEHILPDLPISPHKASFSPNSEYLAAIGGVEDNWLYLWEMKTATIVAVFCCKNKITSYVFSPDSQFLIFSAWYQIKMCHVPSGEILFSRRPVYSF